MSLINSKSFLVTCLASFLILSGQAFGADENLKVPQKSQTELREIFQKCLRKKPREWCLAYMKKKYRRSKSLKKTRKPKIAQDISKSQFKEYFFKRDRLKEKKKAPSSSFGEMLVLGSTGVGIEFSKKIFKNINIRTGYNRLAFSTPIEPQGIEVDVDLDLESFKLVLDWHPFSGIFHLSGGMYYNNNQINFKAKQDQDRFIDEIKLTPAQRATLSNLLSQILTGDILGSLEFSNKIAPYYGIGWRKNPGSKPGWAFALELGAFFQGDPEFTLVQSGGTLVIPADILRQGEQEVENDIADNFNAYPVLTLGVGYFF